MRASLRHDFSFAQQFKPCTLLPKGMQTSPRVKPMQRDQPSFVFTSMTKPITTVAALTLWSREFHMNDPISLYLPENFKN